MPLGPPHLRTSSPGVRLGLRIACVLVVRSPGWRLLETAASGVPHRHSSGPWLLQGHQEGHHPRSDEEGWPSGLHSPASGHRTQEVPPRAPEKRVWAPRPTRRCQPVWGARGAGPGAPRGAEAADRGREQAVVVVLLHVPEPSQAALAPQILAAAPPQGSGRLVSSPKTPCKAVSVLLKSFYSLSAVVRGSRPEACWSRPPGWPRGQVPLLSHGRPGVGLGPEASKYEGPSTL